jgi:hypothetical protein
MVSAIFGAGLWLAICLGEPAAAQTALLPMALSFLVAGFVPIWLRHRHVRAQNRLLERCRVLFMAASQALARGDRATALSILLRIQRLERLWRFGNSVLFRASLLLWAVGTALVLCVLTRTLGLLARDHFWGTGPLTAQQIQEHLVVVAAISLMAPLEAVGSYCAAWRQPWAIDNCGERLWQLLHGPRGLTLADPVAETAPCFEGLSPRVIFGLGSTYTLRELDTARRRLVWDLHPDRHPRMPSSERQAREQALKQVNAAYDILRSGAT